MALILTSLSACSLNKPQTVYDYSVDIPLKGWLSTDTLFYNITVTSPSTVKNPILVSHDYSMEISIRHASDYPLTEVPFQLQLQQTDTTGGYEHPIRNILRQNLSPAVRDASGYPLGDTWGSYLSLETAIQDLTVRFDSAGTYRFLIIPTLGSQTSMPGMASIGIRLR